MHYAVRIHDKIHVVDEEMTRDEAKSNLPKCNLIGDLISTSNIQLYTPANGLGRLHLEHFCTELGHEAPSSDELSQYFR